MPRQTKQQPGELRGNLIMYAGGKTWHYAVRWRGVLKKGDTKCESRTNAVTWLGKEKEKWALEEQGLVGATVPTLKTIWQEWDRVKASSVSPTHRRFMKGVVNQHAAAFLDRPAPALNMAAFEELRHVYLTSKGHGFSKGEKPTVRSHSEGGWNKVAGQLRALYRWAVTRKLLLEVPFKVELLDVSLGARGVLWPEQVQAFLAAVDRVRKERKGDPVPQAGIAARLMIGLGLRENEALHMEWDRIDWRNHMATVAEARTTGHKVKDRTIREIPMPAWLETYLLKWWAHCKRPSDGLLLVSRKETVHGEGATTKAVRLGAQALKITGLTPHGLRRTFATVHFEMGTALTQIAQMMGQEDPMLTMRRYIIQRPKDQAAAQEKAGLAMGFLLSSVGKASDVISDDKK